MKGEGRYRAEWGHVQRGGDGGGEVCPLADGQLAAARVTAHGDLCQRQPELSALSLFVLSLKETAGTHGIIMGNINEVNEGRNVFFVFNWRKRRGCRSNIGYPAASMYNIRVVQHSGVK